MFCPGSTMNHRENDRSLVPACRTNPEPGRWQDETQGGDRAHGGNYETKQPAGINRGLSRETAWCSVSLLGVATPYPNASQSSRQQLTKTFAVVQRRSPQSNHHNTPYANPSLGAATAGRFFEVVLNQAIARAGPYDRSGATWGSSELTHGSPAC